ncbi:MAG: sigma 54-interacting transcriptional regulator [Polyangiaceae bacterium]
MPERTLTEHGYSPPSHRSRPPPKVGALIVESPGFEGLKPVVVDRAVTLGRDDSANIVVNDAGVSRVHLQLEPRGGGLWVTDLGSRNGTFLNGERLEGNGRQAEVGGVIRMGRTVLVLANVAPYAADRAPGLAGLLGGAALDDARFRIVSVAPTKSPVLVLGDTGTGKEVIANLLHEHSGRKGPFVALNCAALPPDLVDAELFGHAKGAFSGAGAARAGQFRAADGGTLFLDEIGEMPMAVQAKLLRALETEEVRAIGSDQPVRVDVRIVAATNRDIDAQVEAESFRADLMHRLSGFRIVLPPLRERREDVAILARNFLAPLGAKLSPAALEKLALHSWPGNVRELRNAASAAGHLALQAGEPEISPDTIASVISREVSEPTQRESEGDRERRAVMEALTAADGDVAVAAQRLGTSRSVLYETLRRLNLEARSFRKR